MISFFRSLYYKKFLANESNTISFSRIRNNAKRTLGLNLILFEEIQLEEVAWKILVHIGISTTRYESKKRKAFQISLFRFEIWS